MITAQSTARYDHFSVNWDETQASPHFRLVSTNFNAFVHCSSELNCILKKEIHLLELDLLIHNYRIQRNESVSGFSGNRRAVCTTQKIRKKDANRWKTYQIVCFPCWVRLCWLYSMSNKMVKSPFWIRKNLLSWVIPVMDLYHPTRDLFSYVTGLLFRLVLGAFANGVVTCQFEKSNSLYRKRSTTSTGVVNFSFLHPT